MIVTIAGTAASGKGTLARRVAKALKVAHYDFGLLYRGIAFAETGRGLERVADYVKAGALCLGDERFAFRGKDITGDLRSETAGLRAARLTASHEDKMAAIAKLFVSQKDFVADGRTVNAIYPNADWQFVLTVDFDAARERRRRQEARTEGFLERWQLDAVRVSYGSRAIVVDTNDATPDESFAEVMKHLTGR